MTKVRKRRSGPGRPPAPAPGRAAAPPQSRAQRKLDKRDRIRRAAWELFTSAGYETTTTKEIAERAGIAAGTLFLYARDKQDLLFLVFYERLSETVDSALGSLPASAPLLEQLMHVFRALLRMYDESPKLSAEFVRAVPGADGNNAHAVNGLTFAFLHRMAALIRVAQERGEIAQDVSPLLAAQNIFTLYFGALMAWLSHFVDQAAALDSLLRQSLELQFRGLYPPAPAVLDRRR